MIKTITTTGIYNTLSTIVAITNVVELYSQKPHDSVVDNITWPYAWFSLVSDVKSWKTNVWALTARCRLSISVYAPLSYDVGAWLNESDIIDNIISIITNAIVDESCTKISTRWSVWSMWCREWDQTPLFYTTSWRSYKVKDYFISYVSHGS